MHFHLELNNVHMSMHYTQQAAFRFFFFLCLCVIHPSRETHTARVEFTCGLSTLRNYRDSSRGKGSSAADCLSVVCNCKSQREEKRKEAGTPLNYKKRNNYITSPWLCSVNGLIFHQFSSPSSSDGHDVDAEEWETRLGRLDFRPRWCSAIDLAAEIYHSNGQ